VWFVPATFWFYSEGTGNGAPWQTAATMLAAGIVIVSLFYRPRSLGARQGTRGATASADVT
jgi:hypothetical protein